jgi:hypothetical protein
MEVPLDQVSLMVSKLLLRTDKWARDLEKRESVRIASLENSLVAVINIFVHVDVVNSGSGWHPHSGVDNCQKRTVSRFPTHGICAHAVQAMTYDPVPLGNMAWCHRFTRRVTRGPAGYRCPRKNMIRVVWSNLVLFSEAAATSLLGQLDDIFNACHRELVDMGSFYGLTRECNHAIPPHLETGYCLHGVS